MRYIWGWIIFFFFFIFLSLVWPKSTIQAGLTSIVINELYYDPSGSDNGYEWIELKNVGNSAINLEGWTIESAGTTFKSTFEFTEEYEVEPGEIITIGEEMVPGVTFETTKLDLQNGGSSSDGVRIINHQQKIVDVLIYDQPNQNGLVDEDNQVVPDEQTAPDVSEGQSLGRDNSLPLSSIDTNNNAKDFYVIDEPSLNQNNQINKPKLNFTLKPAPFYSNLPIKFSLKTDLGEIDIFEIYIDNKLWQYLDNPKPEDILFDLWLKEGKHTIKTLIQANGRAYTKKKEIEVKPALNLFNKFKINEVYPAPIEEDDEFIEIINQSEDSLSLYGFYLTDDVENPRKYQIKSVNKLKSDRWLTLYKEQTKLSLNNDLDKIWLLSPQGQTIDQLSYNKVTEGFTICLFNNKIEEQCSPTPNQSNRYLALSKTGQTVLILPLICLGFKILSIALIIKGNML